MNSTAQRRLAKEFQHISQTAGVEGVLAAPVGDDDLFNWRCAIRGPSDTPYEDGVYEGVLKFPKDYPLSPPSMRFTSEMWHPNIYKDGRVCISILHQPGDDPMHYESADERWGPLQSIDKVLLSISSMLGDPNVNSPANVEAAKELRERPKDYESRVRKLAVKSLGGVFRGSNGV